MYGAFAFFLSFWMNGKKRAEIQKLWLKTFNEMENITTQHINTYAPITSYPIIFLRFRIG